MSNMVAAHVPLSAKARALGMSFTGFHTGEGAHSELQLYCSCRPPVLQLIIVEVHMDCSTHRSILQMQQGMCVSSTETMQLHGLLWLVECRFAQR
jgi:hypothetical protein